MFQGCSDDPSPICQMLKKIVCMRKSRDNDACTHPAAPSQVEGVDTPPRGLRAGASRADAHARSSPPARGKPQTVRAGAGPRGVRRLCV